MPLRVVQSRRELPGCPGEQLSSVADVIRPGHDHRPSAAELGELVRGTDALLCLGNDVVDAELLDAAGSQLRVVGLASMGYDGVDLPAAAQRGVIVTHTPGVLAETTADTTFGLILSARRRMPAAVDSLRAGEWRTFTMDGYLGRDVHGATLGLVGFGQIGRAVAERAAGFGMRVLYHDPAGGDPEGEAKPVALDDLLREADIVSLHVPLTPATRHLIGTDELAAMKPTATLINTSRGGVVDETALLAALAEDRLHSAGLDVFETEPLPLDQIASLAAEPRLVTLPHIGSATEATRAAMVDLAADNIRRVLTGQQPRTPVPASAPGHREAVVR